MFFARFPDHIEPDYKKKRECDPMVYAYDLVLELNAEKIPQKRHDSLKHAEEQSDYKGVFVIHFLHGKALAYSDGERVHRKRDGNGKKLDKTHKANSPLCFFDKMIAAPCTRDLNLAAAARHPQKFFAGRTAKIFISAESADPKPQFAKVRRYWIPYSQKPFVFGAPRAYISRQHPEA